MSEDYSNIYWEIVRPIDFSIGRLLITNPSGTLAAGETITGSTSGATATLVTYNAAYLDVESIVGSFMVGETVTGGTSLKTATVTKVKVGRKQIALVTTDVTDDDGCIATISAADVNLTIYYIAKDRLDSLGQTILIPEQYQMAIYYYIMTHLYSNVDAKQSFVFDRRYADSIKEARRDALSDGVFGGQTLTSHEI